MVVAGDGKPGAHFGGALWGKGDLDVVKKDEVGIETAESVGRRVAGLMEKMN